MNIVVLIKQVPDTAARIKVAADGKRIDESGVQLVLNPYDEIAVEAGLQLVEKAGKGEVRVVTMGPKGAQAAMRTALAMGAESGVHIEIDGHLHDVTMVARTLADELAKLSPAPDLILAGRQSVDAQSLAVAPMVATFLGMPCVTDIVTLAVEGPVVKVERDIEGGRETLEVTLPALLTTQKGLNEPRYPALKGIMKAKKKKIAPGSVSVAEPATAIATMVEPPERKGGRMVGEGAGAVPELVRLLREEAKAL